MAIVLDLSSTARLQDARLWRGQEAVAG